MQDDRIQRYVPASVPERRRPGYPAAPRIMEMEETPDLLAYWRIIRKRRWTILSIFLVLFTVVLFGTLRQTPVYRATTLLEIEKENPDIATVQELFQLDSVSDTYLETQYRILESNSLAGRVIQQLGLTKLKEFYSPGLFAFLKRKPAPSASTNQQVFSVGDADNSAADPEVYNETLQNFMDKLKVDPLRDSRLVEVSFESEDPGLAAQIANSLASNYIEQNLEARWQATQKATEWISQQLVGLKTRLEKSEEDLQQYAQQNGLVFLENMQGGNPENIIDDRMRQVQQALTDAQADLYQKQSLYQLVQSGKLDSLPGVYNDNLIQNLNYRLAELKRNYAELSATFTADYPKMKQLQNQIDELESILKQQQQNAAQEIVDSYNAAVQRVSLLKQAFDQLQDEANRISEKSVQYNILRREVDTNKQLYDGLLQRLKEAGVSAGLNASNIRVIDPATPPEKPARPKPLLNLSLALVLGLGLGVGAAFLQEYLDNTLKTAEDVERFLHLPALALIPAIESLDGRGGVYGLYGYGRRKLLTRGAAEEEQALAPVGNGGKKAGWYRLDVTAKYSSALGEAFRSLRTSVLLSSADRPPRTLVVTSSQPGEGKTTVSINLALSLAQLGQRVLLIDGDMRRPCIQRVFGLEETSGLVGFLTGQRTWQESVLPAPAKDLDILACGPIPPNPAELLSSHRMRTLIEEAMKEYNFVLVDTPPILSVADGRILAPLVEGVVLVAHGGHIPRELVRRSFAHVRDVGGNVLGVVLNNLDVRADDYYYYRYYRYDHYGYGYGAQERDSDSSKG